VVTLYRAEVETGGYFGRLSRWTPSSTYAERLGRRAQRLRTDPRLPVGREIADVGEALHGPDRLRVLWAIEVEIPSPAVNDLRSQILNYLTFGDQAAVDSYSIEGREWVIARVFEMDNSVEESAIYLGDRPLRPTRL